MVQAVPRAVLHARFEKRVRCVVLPPIVVTVDVLISPGRSGLSGAAWNKPRSALDLYTPRYVKGRGPTKVSFASLSAVIHTYPLSFLRLACVPFAASRCSGAVQTGNIGPR